jgi:hypothetical protein
MPDTRPLALWSTPRSASTAFDRMMRQRGDHRVFTEPFSAAYYDGPDRVSARFPRPTEPGPSYDDVWSEVLDAAERSPVFVKEMPHHLGPHLTCQTLARFRSSFLIRDPAWAVPSMLAIWDDATDEELGYGAQRHAFALLEIMGDLPPVIDADDLRRDPARVIAQWCRAMDIEYRPDALSWEPGMPPGWERWPEWFAGAAESRGFAPPPEGPPPEATPETAARIERCREHYLALHRHRLRT